MNCMDPMNSKNRGRTVTLGLMVVTMLVIPSLATATVEPGWPVGTPNVCKNATDGFMNFELGIELQQIASTIPGLEFTTTNGLNWQYSDIRTGIYNVWPTGDYTVNGNFCAWLGVEGDAGRITFLGGTATYLSVLVSTFSGVQLDAYDASNNLLATSGTAENNIHTGFFTRLTVEAPNIAYVMIHDTGNYWIMDDLCTDAIPLQPVPGYTPGPHNERIDLVFVPDKDYNGNIPLFLSDVANNITQRLGAVAPIAPGNLNKFNFYYTTLPGDITSGTYGCGPLTLPDKLLSNISTWADAVVVLHQATRDDCTQFSGSVGVFGAEGAVGRTFIHEGGHAIFFLRDEYDTGRPPTGNCTTTSYDTSRVIPSNIWHTSNNQQNDDDCRYVAGKQGWDPNECYLFTACEGGWYKLGNPSLTTADDKYNDANFRFIMFDGSYFTNGFGAAAMRVVNYVLNSLPVTHELPLPPPSNERSIVLELNIDGGGLSLLSSGFVAAAAPNFLPGDFSLAARIVSTHSNTLAQYGFMDPRAILGEPGYPGPAMLDSARFTLVLPYFDRGARVDLVDTRAGTVLLPVDISRFVSDPGTANLPPVALCGNVIAPANDHCVASASINAGSYDPDGDPLTRTQSPAAPYALGATQVTMTVTDPSGASASCSALVSVKDFMPPTITAPANMVVNATGPTGATVNFAFTAKDNCALASVTAVPPSGSVFPINQLPTDVTIVTGTAKDASGNTASASFTVHVKGALEQLGDLLNAVKGLPPGKSLTEKLMLLSLQLEVQLAQISLKAKQPVVTCGTLTGFIKEVQALSGKKLTVAQATSLIATASRIKAVLNCR